MNISCPIRKLISWAWKTQRFLRSCDILKRANWTFLKKWRGSEGQSGKQKNKVHYNPTSRTVSISRLNHIKAKCENALGITTT